MKKQIGIVKRADEIFNERYSVRDILVGDTIAMHRECMEQARRELVRKIEFPVNGQVIEDLQDVILENKTMTHTIKDTNGEEVIIEFMTFDEIKQRSR